MQSSWGVAANANANANADDNDNDNDNDMVRLLSWWLLIGIRNLEELGWI